MSIDSQLQKILKKKDTSLNRVATVLKKNTKAKLKENLNREWYMTYEPTTYQRSYELLESVTGKVTKNGLCNYLIDVFFDGGQMNVSRGKGWNKHMGFNGEDFRHGLISSIEHGIRGLHINPRYGEATHVIENTQAYAIGEADRLIKQYKK